MCSQFHNFYSNLFFCPPRIDGVVVAEENQELLMEAWRQEEQMMIEKEMKVGV